MEGTIDLGDLAKIISGYSTYVERKQKSKQYAQSYYETHKDTIKQRANDYYEKNKDKVLLKQKSKYDIVRKKPKKEAEKEIKYVSLDNFTQPNLIE